MKILITGGTTFVSRYVAEHFVSKSNKVFVLNRNSRPQSKGVHLIKCDRLKLGNILNGLHFDLVIDITAYNEQHIKTLLDSGISFSDFIFISSSAVYPETNVQPFSENQICGKNSVWGDYGVNKMNAENYLLEHIPNAYILRPPYFYGIYENLYREAFPFDCAMLERDFYIPENGDMKLQFFNVSDLCRFIEILIKLHPNQHIFNVGNNETITIKEWVKLCYKVAGKEPKFVSVSKKIPKRNYFCFYDYEYILDVSEQNQLMPETISLEYGLKEEFEWYKNHKDSIYNRKPYLEYIDKNISR